MKTFNTSAELLRDELQASAPFTMEELIQEIIIRIKGYSRASFVCDSHIDETDLKRGVICKKDEETAISFAVPLGFCQMYNYDGRGVRYLVFTL